MPSRTQAGTAILIQTETENLLFDCGRGCTTRLAQYDPALLPRVDRLFLTHLHSDHVVGIPDLWLNGWTQGRTTPLRVWGPKGSKAMMAGLRKAFAADISYRRADGIPASEAGIAPAVTTVRRDGPVHESGDLRVTAFAVRHGGIPAFGYRIDKGDLSVLISGDTAATPQLARYGRGVDVALLEVASPPMVAYVRRSFSAAQAQKILGLHLTAEEAGDALAAMQPGIAIYYHSVTGEAADAALLAATRTRYSGRVEVAGDLTRIDIYPDHQRVERAP
ncbi:MAG TPA: MBL fold metallo-hydrolase [Sphingopyxis sp.]|nr:MBL fold metallo-hydrolase [Sphingopyxis sp.]HMP45329.1 MBL fold metallo-hydrolase [Sphingopyxis sp.]HMQ18020.1 MBL fold metallo-hydrolase [Sphingopyxis sp.]